MAGEDEAFGDIRFLTGSPQRVAIMNALCAEAARPTDLSDRVDATRTTVQRVLSGFLERGWVEKRDGRYHVTPTGHRVCEAYESFERTVARAREVGPVVSNLGGVGADLPEAAYEEGTVTVGTEQDPLAAVDHLIAWFRAASGQNIRLVSPIVSRTFNQIGASLLEEGTTYEMIIDEGVLERSAADFPEALDRAIEREEVEVAIYPEGLSFGLAISSDSVILSGYDETNNLRALLESDHQSVREWSHGVFDRMLEESTPLSERITDGE